MYCLVNKHKSAPHKVVSSPWNDDRCLREPFHARAYSLSGNSLLEISSARESSRYEIVFEEGNRDAVARCGGLVS